MELKQKNVFLLFKNGCLFSDILCTFRSESEMPGRVSLLLAMDTLPQCYQFLRCIVSKGYSNFELMFPNSVHMPVITGNIVISSETTVLSMSECVFPLLKADSVCHDLY